MFNVGPETTVLRRDMTRAPARRGRHARPQRPIPLGYYKDQVKTAATFKVVDGVRWSIPGDRHAARRTAPSACWAAARVCINTGGEKVHPEEVEAVLLAHPAVFDAAVVGAPHQRWGEAVTALVQLREGAKRSRTTCGPTPAADLQLQGPQGVILLSEVPRTAVSKVDYRRAKEIAQRYAGS